METIIGFFIAFAIAVTGVGAGTITAPVLMLFVGVEPAVAVGTALLFSLVVKIPAGLSYWRKKKVDVPTLALMAAGGMPGVLVGTQLLGRLSETPELKAILIGAVGVIVLFSAFVNIYMMTRGVDLSAHHATLRKLIPLFTFVIGAEVGFSSAGAGALGTLLLFSTTGLFACTVVGTDIIFGLILSAVGGGIHLGMGNVDPGLLLPLSVGGVFGALAGVRFAAKVPTRPLRYALLGWLVFIGSQLLYRGVTG
jgi:hypothetical protein